MAERQVRRMPVVDARAAVLRGIIAQADVATRVNSDKTTGEMVESISEPRRRTVATELIKLAARRAFAWLLRRGI